MKKSNNKFSRRKFIELSAATTAGIAFIPGHTCACENIAGNIPVKLGEEMKEFLGKLVKRRLGKPGSI